MPIGMILKFGIPLLILLAIGGLWKWGDGWKKEAVSERNFVTELVVATGVAANDPNSKIKVKITRKNVKDQILALGDSNKSLKIEIDHQNKEISKMVDEAIRLKKNRDVLRNLYKRAEAQRSAAIKEMAKSERFPSKAKDCQGLLEDAEKAMDAARRAGI